MLSKPCAPCNMRCCTHFNVPVTVFDIGRVCEKLKCNLSGFCSLVPADRVEQAPHANVFLFDEKGGMREMALVLRKKEDGSCIFFGRVRGCGIHGFHPLACRAYPFVFDWKGKLKYNRHFICPRKWKEGEYDEDEMKEALDGMEKEISSHDRIIRKWNAKKAKEKKGKTAEKEFFRFLQSEIKAAL